MRKALTVVTALALALGATTAAGAGTAAATDRAHGRSSRGSRASGAIVVDWNEELLRMTIASARRKLELEQAKSSAEWN